MNPPPSVSSHHRRAPNDSLLERWEAADTHVPTPFLLYWVARPAEGKRAATLRELDRIDFVYANSTNFIILLACQNGAFGHAIIERAPPAVNQTKFMPIMGRTQIALTPEQAETRIEAHALRQDHRFWTAHLQEPDLRPPAGAAAREDFLRERHRRLPWRFVCLQQPRQAGVTEPTYRFRKQDCPCEFIVGAQSGIVEHRWVEAPLTPPPPVVPPPA